MQAPEETLNFTQEDQGQFQDGGQQNETNHSRSTQAEAFDHL